MPNSHLLATLLLSLLLAACSSGIETRPAATDNFIAGNYQYYKWRSEPLVNTGLSADMIYTLDPVLRAEVDAELANKGYILNAEKARFSVDYIYAPGVRQGERSSEASNLQTRPTAIANRQVNQAVVDNAYALGGVKETNNIGLQFNDVGREEEVWRVIITKIVENANSTDNTAVQRNVRKAVQEGLKTLPQAQ